MTMSRNPGPMPAPTVRPNTHSRHLPPYRGILAVDAKDFTGYPAVQHEEISRIIPQLLQSAFANADLMDLWEDRRFPDTTGDGYVFGFDPSLMPYVIHPWLKTLQELLAEFNVNSLGTVRIRLRASLHIGPLPDTDDAFGGNGTPRNDTHRLLDSKPVKAVLSSQSENVTQVAAILSDRCYQDAVASGYTGRNLDYFTEVPATVEGKQFDQRAWLYVPAPSGNLYDPQVMGRSSEDDSSADGTPAAADRRSSRDSPGPATVNWYRADRSAFNTGTVSGDQRVTNVEEGGHYIEGGYTEGGHFAGGYVAGDRVGGNKTGTVHGHQGDIVHGTKKTRTHHSEQNFPKDRR